MTPCPTTGCISAGTACNSGCAAGTTACGSSCCPSGQGCCAGACVALNTTSHRATCTTTYNATTQTCTPQGCRLKDGQSGCTAGTDCLSRVCTACYPDSDGDGFSNKWATVPSGRSAERVPQEHPRITATASILRPSSWLHSCTRARHPRTFNVSRTLWTPRLTGGTGTATTCGNWHPLSN